ncbi:N-acetylglucosamine-6-phosphate deacetylase [Sphingobacterium bovistauri]|uniref:N-acetylglucosamine-6-phosphate deacetylase n=1 Tax=Sphingobacterium bovistauri TaxID=2781959 RepID=A0ABS7Z6C6_9SPHI|nr:N-acetylglucosamine-6-phosphate deacetylase [Sphingobacterium bovistauri]MCA5005705.1 N-acetylglucosamine-6-phosphate deacetylase [Sphingobacterium bovistauri]
MKSKFALTNGIIFTTNNTLTHKSLLVDGIHILEIVDESAIPSDFERIDVNGKNICPGLIDLQIYGAGGSLFSSELTTESISKIEQTLLRQGCTSFYLTLATNTLDLFKEAIAIFKSASPKVALGLHLEGPFLNPIKRGAHPEELITQASVAILEDLLFSHQGVVKMMTIAPELMQLECMQYLQNQGVLLSAGHSNATFQQATDSFEMGVKTVTHLWNAMSVLHHRNVGLPGATYNHDSVHASIIVDGIHVDYEAVKVSKSMMKNRLFLITDAVTDCAEGIYQHILNEDHYVLPDGTLSGSALTMLKAVENCVNKVGIPLDEALRMATLYPADLIGRNDLGRLEQGALANILVFDENFNVDSVYFEGHAIKLKK